MFSDLTKASNTTYLCSSLDLHGPAINAYTYPFLFAQANISFKTSFSRQVYMHVNCIMQGFVDVKQRFNPPICNMYPYVQL